MVRARRQCRVARARRLWQVRADVDSLHACAARTELHRLRDQGGGGTAFARPAHRRDAIGNLGDISFRALATLAAADAGARRGTPGPRRRCWRITVSRRRSMPITSTMPSRCGQDPEQAARGRQARPDLGCRHAAGLRPRLQARRRTRGTEGLPVTGNSRPLRGACRAGARRPADGPLLLRGLPAAEIRRPPRPADRACGDPRARWCSSNRRVAWPRCWRTPHAVLGEQAGRRWRANSPNIHEKRPKRGTARGELAEHYQGEEDPRGEIVVINRPSWRKRTGAGQMRRHRRTPAARRWRSVSLKEAVAQVAAETGQPRRKDLCARPRTHPRQAVTTR